MMQSAPQASDPDPAPATAFQQQKQDLLRRASRKAPLTTQPRRCQYVREGETDHIAQVCPYNSSQRTADEADGGSAGFSITGLSALTQYGWGGSVRLSRLYSQ